MVAKLTDADHAAFDDAVDRAERLTSAKISIVVDQASDDYHDFTLLYGFIAGSILSFILWVSGSITNFSALLVIQTAVIVLTDTVPWAYDVCINFVPKHIRYRRASREAMRAYHHLHSQISPAAPFVLLYVSIADHYVHVVTNPLVHQLIPGHWDSVTSQFASGVEKQGIRAACTQALSDIGEILGTKFPNY